EERGHVLVRPVLDLDVLGSALWLREIEDDFPARQAAPRPPDRAIGPGAVHRGPQTAVGLFPDEDEDVRRVFLGPVIAHAPEEILLREVPGEPARELETVEHLGARREEIGTQVLVAPDQRADEAPARLRE